MTKPEEDAEASKVEYQAVRFKDLLEPFRPLRANPNFTMPGWFLVYDPINDQEVPVHADELHFLGGWEDTSSFTLRDKPVTWAQYAAHQLGQVLKQHMIVDGLVARGITRIRKEPYAAPIAKYHKWRYDFNLTYDEMDALLSSVIFTLTEGDQTPVREVRTES